MAHDEPRPRSRDSVQVKGLRAQLQAVLACSCMEANWHRYRPPAVVVALPETLDADELTGSITGMGVSVVRSFNDIRLLDVPRPELGHAVLETSTLCALVSEVTWGPEREEVAAWSMGNVHWDHCVRYVGSKGLVGWGAWRACVGWMDGS